MKPFIRSCILHPSRSVAAIALIAWVSLAPAIEAAGTWKALANRPPEGIVNLSLLPDGTVFAKESTSERWYRLTPDAFGGYQTGTWSSVAPMHDTRRWFAAQVLTNGQFFVAGGEYGSGLARGEIWDLPTRTWRRLPATGAASIRDSESKLLPNGDVLVGPVYPGLWGDQMGESLLYRVAEGRWERGPSMQNHFTYGPFSLSGPIESSWLRLRDDSILTVDPLTSTSQRYIPSLNRWVVDSPLPVELFSLQGKEPYGGYETGPAFLLADGRALFVGGTGATALYTPSGSDAPGSWVVGPTIPDNHGVADGSGAVLPNGNVLFAAGFKDAYDGPTYFFEYRTASNTIHPVNGPGGTTLPSMPYQVAMLVLPDGNVLVSQAESPVLYVYHPDGVVPEATRPSITSVTPLDNGLYRIQGLQLAGVSEGAALGDDAQMSTAFPLVRLVDSNGHVFHARTVRFDATSLQAGTKPQVCDIELPGGLLGGTLSMTVVANGVASSPVPLDVVPTRLPTVENVRCLSATASTVSLSWNRVGGYENGYRVERSDDGIGYTTVAETSATASSFIDNTVTPLHRYLYRIVATNAAGDGGRLGMTYAATPGDPTPPGWVTTDIGQHPGRNAATATADSVTLLAAGRPLVDALDFCRVASRILTGDFTMTVHLASLDAAGPETQTGLMIRNSNSPSSPMIGLGVDADHRAVLVYRPLVSSLPFEVARQAVGQRAEWLRLVRAGNSIQAFTATDGLDWHLLGTTALELPRKVYAGTFLTSGVEWKPAAAFFDSFLVSATDGILAGTDGVGADTVECHGTWTAPGVVLRPAISLITTTASNLLAMPSTGQVVSWGTPPLPTPAAATNLLALSGGRNHVVALDRNGRILAWGDNSLGQTKAPSGTGYRAIAAGGFHNVAIDPSGNLVQWGDKSHQQTRPSPYGFGLGPPVAVAAGAYFSISLHALGEVNAWGDNSHGELEVASTSPPWIVWGTSVAIAAGAYHGLALGMDGLPRAWGDNSHGQTDVPLEATNVVAIAAGGFHSLALRRDGTIVTWGDDSAGQRRFPAGLRRVTAIAASGNHSLALLDDGAVVVCGDLQDAVLPPELEPVRVSSTAVGEVDARVPGRYPVEFHWTNLTSSLSGAFTREIRVVDSAPPSLVLNEPDRLRVLANTPFVDPGATAHDACAGDLTGAIVTEGAVDLSVPGTYTLKYSVSDAAGRDQRDRTVVVESSVAVPEARIQSTATGEFLVTIESLLGVTYQLLESTDLAAGMELWTPASNLVPGNGTQVQFPAPSSSKAARYYRIRAQ